MRGKRALLNIFTAIIELAAVTITGFVVPHYIIRTYGSSVNGLILSITQFLGYISLIESGIGAIGRASLYKPLAENDGTLLSGNVKALELFYRKISYIFIVYVVALAFLFPLLVNQDFDWSYTAIMVVILAFSTFIQYYFGITYQTVIQADQKKYIPSLLQTLTVLLNMLITVVLIKIGANVHIVKLGSTFAYAVRPIILYIYVRKHYKIDKRVEPRSEILKQRWDGLTQHIAFFIHKNTDIVILTIFATLTEVSVYSVYLLAVSGCSKVVNIFSNNFEPAFGNMIAKGEKETLKSRVGLCSFLTTQITVVLFSAAAIVISPFIELYTRGVTDANYLRPVFGIVILVAEAFYCIRMPYQSAVYAAGHFKQTRNGAIVEAILNMVLSAILVFFFGLIGVAIGTLVAMLFRTCQYVFYYHTNLIQEKNGLRGEIKRLIVAIIEIGVIVLLAFVIPAASSKNYFLWILTSCLRVILCSTVVLIISCIFYRKELKEVVLLFKHIVARKKTT